MRIFRLARTITTTPGAIAFERGLSGKPDPATPIATVQDPGSARHRAERWSRTGEKRACQRINTTKIAIALSKCLVPHPRIASFIKQLGAISAPAEQRNQHRLSTKSARLAGSGNNGIEPRACPPLTSLQAGAGRVGAVNDCRPSVDNEVDCCKPAPCAVSRTANPATPKPAARFGEARDIAERGARRECQTHRERAAASGRLQPIMRRPHENDLIGHMLRDHSRGRDGRIDAILESRCVIWRRGVLPWGARRVHGGWTSVDRLSTHRPC